MGDTKRPPISPYENPITGPKGSMPVNLSGGLKARGHPVGGTGLFQIAENYLQITERMPNARAQVARAKIGISNSVGGPGNNNYVTIIEATGNRRTRAVVPEPRHRFESSQRRPPRAATLGLDGHEAIVEAATTIYVTGRGNAPAHVALLSLDGRRVFAKLDQPPREGEVPEQVLAGQKVKLLVKDDGDHYFQISRGLPFDLGRIVNSIRRRVGGETEAEDTGETAAGDTQAAGDG